MEFLSLKNNAIGLDISECSLKILKLKKKKNKIGVVSYAFSRLEKGIVQDGKVKDIDKLARAIKEALKEAKGEKFNTKDVVCSLPEEKTFLFSLKIPFWAHENPLLAISSEAKNYLPLPVEKFSIDFEIISQSEKEHSCQVLVSAVEKEILNGYFMAVKQAGLNPIIFEPESFAIARAIFREKKEGAFLIVDFGETKTNFIIFWNGYVRETFSVPISSQSLTEKIAKELNVSFQEAESMKVNYGLGKVFRLDFKKWKNEIFETILPVIVALVQEMKKFIAYYETHDSATISQILLAGGGSNLKGFPKFLSFELEQKVQRADPFLEIDSSFARDKQLIFGTALGLALLGI